MSSLRASEDSMLNTQAPFSIVSHHLLAHLADNFTETDLERLETQLLNTLCVQRQLRGVIFDFSEVITTDRHDLERLGRVFQTIKLLGVRVALCGINPGLAAVIVGARLNFDRELIGSDIDDVLSCL